MLVKNWMSRPAVTIEADASIGDAMDLMRRHEIDMLPVLEDNRLAGVVTDRDLKQASVSDIGPLEIHELAELVLRLKIRVVMSPNPHVIRYDHTVEEAATRMFVYDISGMPVIDQIGAVIGVITKSDLFRVLLSLTGFEKRGIQFAMRLLDRPGAIKEITDIIRDYGGRIASILSTRQRSDAGYFNVYIRVYGIDAPLRQRLAEILKQTFKILYIVDHESNTRDF
jgi:acetoin utilization protein AcuB